MGEMPADNLPVPQPSSEVTTQKPLSCGFQPPPFPFQAKIHITDISVCRGIVCAYQNSIKYLV